MGKITVILAWWVAEKMDKIKLAGYSGSRAQSMLVLTGKELVRPANGPQVLSSVHLCLGGTCRQGQGAFWEVRAQGFPGVLRG